MGPYLLKKKKQKTKPNKQKKKPEQNQSLWELYSKPEMLKMSLYLEME